ncbi:D-alanyl-D-alanine carboxypeptidase family protein [Candidatus Neoehrlichia procyonis]|uniref:serine-type D-Ala-D-Ala carboxypeptidase n=1 Tax=Candidatus Neoehrlichia procyonis str. RAC413 TaxID=1359163 RepID=A0A0F3NNW9_9RICK|nr:D-alanyl-D-alanine carboxypeptidase family protein [Candidatus Neoehrlichia lotoris]KJV69466.1 D-alanyl-D-alanine carboxypeptidase family protein [Candidatus Neoehrlichia lotoris str. RAC413]
MHIVTFLTLSLFIFTTSSLNAFQLYTKAPNAIVFELNSNSILFARNAEEKIVPSSMSKLMTLYIAFQYLKAGIIKMDDKFVVSKSAWQRGGSSIFLREGQQVKVRDLINGIVVASGNDACITLAEGISGSQQNFVDEMNNMAQKLGLTKSHFSNVTGWPDENHLMSAKDIVFLSVRIFKDFPEYYHLFSQKDFTYNNIYQKNNNILLQYNIGVDGIKTGHTNKGGYGLIASAEQNSRRIFVVVSGLKHETERVSEAKKLISYSFNNFNTKTIFHKNSQIDQATVWYGKDKVVPLTIHDDVTVTYHNNSYDKIKAFISRNNIIPAPIRKGQKVGELHIQIPELGEKVVPVYAMKNVRSLNYFEKILHMLLY